MTTAQLAKRDRPELSPQNLQVPAKVSWVNAEPLGVSGKLYDPVVEEYDCPS